MECTLPPRHTHQRLISTFVQSDRPGLPSLLVSAVVGRRMEVRIKRRNGGLIGTSSNSVMDREEFLCVREEGLS